MFSVQNHMISEMQSGERTVYSETKFIMALKLIASLFLIYLLIEGN